MPSVGRVLGLLAVLALAVVLPVQVRPYRAGPATVYHYPRLHYPRIHVKGQSVTYDLNWAGYADVLPDYSILSVNASWIVPNVTCGSKTTYVAVWVGIDGFNDNTVEQTGIQVQCSGGKAYYSAWYEFYPAAPVSAPSSDVVKPGDKIVAWVVYNPSTNEFKTVLVDVTEGWNYTSPWTSVSGALDDSAEWVVERPAIGNSLTTLADFGTAYFNVHFTNITPLGDFYLRLSNGSVGNISSFNYTAMIMVNNKGQILAEPSGLYAYGSSFYVCYGSCTTSSSSPHKK